MSFLGSGPSAPWGTRSAKHDTGPVLHRCTVRTLCMHFVLSLLHHTRCPVLAIPFDRVCGNRLCGSASLPGAHLLVCPQEGPFQRHGCLQGERLLHGCMSYAVCGSAVALMQYAHMHWLVMQCALMQYTHMHWLVMHFLARSAALSTDTLPSQCLAFCSR